MNKLSALMLLTFPLLKSQMTSNSRQSRKTSASLGVIRNRWQIRRGLVEDQLFMVGSLGASLRTESNRNVHLGRSTTPTFLMRCRFLASKLKREVQLPAQSADHTNLGALMVSLVGVTLSEGHTNLVAVQNKNHQRKEMQTTGIAIKSRWSKICNF